LDDLEGCRAGITWSLGLFVGSGVSRHSWWLCMGKICIIDIE
jgi:hypothetical protein